MPEPETKSKSHAGTVAVWVTVLLAVYLLLPGPLLWLEARKGVPLDIPGLRAAYAPLRYLVSDCQPVAEFYNWYIGLFMDSGSP